MTVPAWLLHLGADRVAAVGWADQVHLVYEPELHAVPAAPAHCDQALFLGQRCVPVFDPRRWFEGGARGAGFGRCIGVYQFARKAGGDLALGAIWLDAPPRRIEVDDTMGAELPRTDAARWAPIAAACFDDGVRRVPVLDLPRLFGPPETLLERMQT